MSPTAATPRLTHVPALDGLRGLAVAGVVAYHLDRLRGGYLGVDLFFVLSGFLITSLLLAEHDNTGGVSLRDFWERRVRRLLPAMLCVVAASGVYAATIAKPDELARLRREGLAALVYVSNWVQLGSGDNYFDRFARPSVLRHFWSLAIEEQFYLFWPIVFVLLVKRTRQPARLVGVVCAVGASASFGAAMWMYSPDESTLRLYYGTDTRIGAILAGGVAACVVNRWKSRNDEGSEANPHWASLVVSAVSLAILAVGWAALDGLSPVLWRGGLASLSVLAAVVVGLVGTGLNNAVTTGLSVPPLRWLGKISYSLYLWHWPVIVILDEGRAGFGGIPLDLLRVGVSVLLAVGSSALVERPIRSGRLPRPQMVRAAFAAVALVATMVTWGTRPIGEVAGPVLIDASDLGVDPADGAPSGGSRPTTTSIFDEQPLRLVVVGDSVGENFGQAAERLADRFGFVARDSSVPGCPLVSEAARLRWADGTVITTNSQCSDWALRWPLNIADTRANTVLMVFGAALQPETEVGPDAWAAPCDASFDRFWRANLDRALDVLEREDIRTGIATVPYYRGYRTDEGLDRETDCINREIRAAAAGRQGVSVVDLAAWVCPESSCVDNIEGVELRPDGLHFSDATAEVALNWALTDLLGQWSHRVMTPNSTPPTTSRPSAPTSTVPPDSARETQTTTSVG